jgi:outer membrane protein assembly factor BamB
MSHVVQHGRALSKLVCLLFLLSVQVAIATDWPRWRGANHDGVSSESDWKADWGTNSPPVNWSEDLGYGLSSVSVVGDHLYTMGNKHDRDIVYCLDVTTGRTVWSHEYACALLPRQFSGGPTATPTVSGDRVYTLSREGHCFSFDAKSGKLIWKQNVAELSDAKISAWGLSSSPLVVGEKLILNVGSSGMALHRDTGKLIWKSKPALNGFSSVIPFRQGKIAALAVFGTAMMTGVQQSDGKVLWEWPWATRFGENVVDPLFLPENQMLVTSAHGMGAELLSLKKSAPTSIWKQPDFGNHVGTPAVWDGHLFGSEGRINRRGAHIKCVSIKTGDVVWSEPEIAGSFTLANGYLLLMTLKGTLMIGKASADGFKPTTNVSLLKGACWTPPILVNGNLYLRSGSGTLLSLNVKR